VPRFITARSSVWLCRQCAGVQTAERYGSSPGGGLIRHPISAGGRDLKYWLVAGGFLALALFTALHQGLIH